MNARDRILTAFRELVLSVPFDEVKTHDVIRRAGVARSTFYVHFRGKNDLLLSSLRPILSVLSSACRGDVDPGLLTRTLEHVWENRAMGRVFFQGPASDRLAREIVRMLLEADQDPSRSYFVANGLLGTLGAWTMGQLPLGAGELSDLLVRLTWSTDETSGTRRTKPGSTTRHPPRPRPL